MTFRLAIIPLAFTCALVGCSKTEAPRASAADIIEVELSKVPQSVIDVVKAEQAEFQMNEVLKKVRDGRVYYDVEGKLANGDEIEFDVLMTTAGPEIVEIQRDIIWTEVPQNARAVVDSANTDSLKITRIIESLQTDKSIIYEVFVAEQSADPRFEVRLKDGQVNLLPSRWQH